MPSTGWVILLDLSPNEKWSLYHLRGTEVTRKYIQVAYQESDFWSFYLVIIQNIVIYSKHFTCFQYEVTTAFWAQKGSISQQRAYDKLQPHLTHLFWAPAQGVQHSLDGMIPVI